MKDKILGKILRGQSRLRLGRIIDDIEFSNIVEITKGNFSTTFRSVQEKTTGEELCKHKYSEIMSKKIGSTVHRAFQTVCELNGVKSGDLSLILCNDSIISLANHVYLDSRTSTDVLSFETGREVINGQNYVSGEMFLSVETSLVQAKRFKIKLLDEISILAVHGSLHLLGFDHELSLHNKTIMLEAERKSLNFLNLAPQSLIGRAE